MTIGSVKSGSSAGFPIVVVVNGFLFVVVVVTRCGKGGKVYGPFRFSEILWGKMTSILYESTG